MTRTLKRMLKVAEHFELLSHVHQPPFRLNSYRPGHWQRSAGAWSFVIVDTNNVEVMGSGWPCWKVWKMFNESPSKLEVYRGVELL